MLANTAFLLGLTLALAPQADELVTRLTFGQARRNFYQAARYGLDAELLWPCGDNPSPRPHAARRLLQQLIPLAHDGLQAIGVAGEEVASLLDIFAARTMNGMTGSVWQLAALAAFERHYARDAALAAMLERYLEHSASGAPVHAWPVPPGAAPVRP
jgi:hypothetical protein